MAEHQLPKLNTWVRFPSPAPYKKSLANAETFAFMRLCSYRFVFSYRLNNKAGILKKSLKDQGVLTWLRNRAGPNVKIYN